MTGKLAKAYHPRRDITDTGVWYYVKGSWLVEKSVCGTGMNVETE